ncbi:peptide MFS transporter [Pseudoflavitalea sp. G-6-1-2]|uniref:peptide MFS transporter n=1 Tax=Pseudoflavitalea sp. G-6-1-2 TaxID=2728841 RepID=UPI00146CDC54|nr:peptide MFS transporter [Pseudoflavitalea sp. G-6-1-2]NML22410.1 peptide MFS transporter [Pseudoflavitalea sp. G-6-1-2]
MNNKHPRGLYLLFTIEMWERFSFYGMRAVLVLFMTKALLFDKAFASNLYGSYTGFIYLTPLVGGYIADRWWGNKRLIVAGGLMMAAGEIILFFAGSLYITNPQLAGLLFFSGLGCMISGNGLFKPNISTLVGQLYTKEDSRKDVAYTIFYMGINIGGALGPILCSLAGDTGNPADFRWAFLTAGGAMLLSVIIIHFFFNKHIKDPEGKLLGTKPAGAPAIVSSKVFATTFLAGYVLLMIALLYFDAKVISFLPWLLLGSAIFIAAIIFSDKSLLAAEKRGVAVIFIVAFFVIFFWSAFEQTGASLVFFADEQTDRRLGFLRWEVPPSLFQSFGSIFLVSLAPLFAWLWTKMGRRQPSSPAKMAIGLLLLGLGYLWIAQGVKNVHPGVKVSMIWLTVMYALHAAGELCLSPIGLSLVNKLAPLKFASLLMAVWFLATAAAQKTAGVLSALYPANGKATYVLGYTINNLYDFFMFFVLMTGIASLTLFLLTKKLLKMMPQQ